MQGPTNVSALGKKKAVDLFSILLVAVVVVAVVSAVAVYRSAFGAGLSLNPDRWSAFGSYVGGVFGPLISFLTLLAILKTIGLQRDLLETQRSEFETMQALQVKAVEAQLSQIKSSEVDAARRLIEETRINALQALDRYMDGLRSEYDHKKNNVNSIYGLALEGKASVQADDLVRMMNKLKEYEKMLAAMTILYGDICFGEFKGADELRKAFQKGVTEIWHPNERGSDATGV